MAKLPPKKPRKRSPRSPRGKNIEYLGEYGAPIFSPEELIVDIVEKKKYKDWDWMLLIAQDKSGGISIAFNGTPKLAETIGRIEILKDYLLRG